MYLGHVLAHRVLSVALATVGLLLFFFLMEVLFLNENLFFFKDKMKTFEPNDNPAA